MQNNKYTDLLGNAHNFRPRQQAPKRIRNTLVGLGLGLAMRSLLPKHLRDLFKKEEKRERYESQRFAADTQSNLELGLTVTQQPQAPQPQFEKERENLACWKSLTPREQEVTALVCMGQRNYQIAETLGIAFGTVKSHLVNIFKKFNLRDRHEIRLALRDWDFPTWWRDRHLLPAPYPTISTYR